MRALVKGSQRLEIREVPDPVPASDQMLVRVEAVSLNRGEIRTVTLAQEGVIPGWDVAGSVVRASADGKGFAEETRVAAILPRGGWAELAAVSVKSSAAIPDGVSPDAAATLPIAGLTAYRALELGRPLLGSRVLVTGASGGVGRITVQLGRLGGARVTGVVSPRRSEIVRSLGAEKTVASIDEAEGEFDLILESVGGSSLARAVDLVAPGGLVVAIGNSSEEETTFNARDLYRKGAASIYGLLIFEEVSSGRIGSRELKYLLELVASGRLDPGVAATRSWRDAGDVLAMLERREVSGKAVLKID